MINGVHVRGSSSWGRGAAGLSIRCGVLLLYATGCKMGNGGSSGIGSSRKSTLRQEESSSNHWLTVRLYTLDERLWPYDDGVLDLGGKVLEARLGIKGVGGNGLYWSGGGVRLMKLWNDGIACSIPLSEEEEDALDKSGGRLSEPVGCGDGILQSRVSRYPETGFASTYIFRCIRKLRCRGEAWRSSCSRLADKERRYQGPRVVVSMRSMGDNKPCSRQRKTCCQIRLRGRHKPARSSTGNDMLICNAMSA